MIRNTLEPQAEPGENIVPHTVNLRKQSKCILSAAVLTYSVFSNAAPSFEGADSVPLYHPLCLPEARIYEEQGGAFDMNACAAKWKEIPVKLTPNQGYFAKRPTNLEGDSQGYVVYKPLGTLDGALELLLVHDKTEQPDLTASVYVLGRLPDLSSYHRDFLTSIDEMGKRCRGGIQSAELISESLLKVSFNVNPYTMMQAFRGEPSDPDQTPVKENELPLDNRETSCAGTLIKHYNLLEGKEFYSSVYFSDGITRLVPQNSGQACYERLVTDFVTPPQRVSVEDFYTFISLYEDECAGS